MKSEASEPTLVNDALRGDQSAFTELYRVNRPRVLAQVSRAVRDRDDVEDLVQMTFVKAFSALPRFRRDAAFSTWLTRIAINVSASHLRQRKTREGHQERLEMEPDLAVLPAARNPSADLFRHERSRSLRSQVLHLPTNYRRALWLHYIREWSYEEITRSLDVPIGTLKIWLHRGRQRLRSNLLHLEEDFAN